MTNEGRAQRDLDAASKSDRAPAAGSPAYLPKPEFRTRSRPLKALALAVAAALLGWGAFAVLSPARVGPAGAGALGAADFRRDRVFLLSAKDLADAPAVEGAAPNVAAALGEGSRRAYAAEVVAEEGSGEIEWLSGAAVLARTRLAAGARARVNLPLRPEVEQALNVRVLSAGPSGLRVSAVSSVGRLRTKVLLQGASEDWWAAFTEIKP